MKEWDPFWAGLLVLAVVSFAVLYWGPSNVVVTKDGKVEGWLNKTRAYAQGQGFWEQQLDLVLKEVQYAADFPRQQAADDRAQVQWERENEAWEAEFYAENPDLRPSRVQAEAEELRARADAIEEAEFRREMLAYFAQQEEEMRAIERAIRCVLLMDHGVKHPDNPDLVYCYLDR